MTRYPSIGTLSIIVLVISSACLASSLQSFDEMHAAAIVISDRTSTTFFEARSIVESAGAYGVQMFPPDAIFGYFTARPQPSQFAGLGVDLCFSRRDLAGKGLGGIVERVVGDLFDQKEIIRQEEMRRAASAGDAAPFEDRTLEIPHEIIRATMPPARSGPLRCSTMEHEDRGIQENSEFLVGTVLINIIFPESAGASEDWTDDEIAGAMSGIALGISQYSQYAIWFKDLSFVYNYADYRRVPVSMEPIESNMSTDEIWMGEALSNIGYDEGDIIGSHRLNNAKRNVFKTEWVFTAFIADMSNHYSDPDYGCWGGAGYVAYAWLGGPYILVPYPACRYGYGLGFGRVFIHEMSHIFWALDEYAAAEEGCGSRSGYLNVANRNTLYMPCQTTVPCIMQTASPPFTIPLPICEYTLGQVGQESQTINGTDYLKIYAIPPTVEFRNMPGMSDTLLPGEEYFISVEMENDAVLNQNSRQWVPEGHERVSYAPYIKSGWICFNKQAWQLEMPSDGKWANSSRESVAREISSELEPGLNTIDFRAENRIGLTGVATKELFLIGLKFKEMYAFPVGNTVRIEWRTAVESFGATFDVLRSDLTTGEEEEKIATVSVPDGVSNVRAYSYVDNTVQATHRYRYRILGNFTITFRGQNRDYSFSSHDVTATASIPIAEGFVSNVMPNPSRDRVMFTVDVPRSYGNASVSRVPAGGGRASSAMMMDEIATSVEISVYDVRGRRIKDVFAGSIRGCIMTREWDGTDSSNITVPSGIYFLRVVAGNETAVKKIVILR